MTTPAPTHPATEQADQRSRMPNPLRHVPEMAKVAEVLHTAVADGPIPATTVSLVQLRAGQLLGSTYFTVRDAADLRRAGESEERISAVATWRDAPYFTGAERSALELVEAVLTPNPTGERVSDEVYARAAEHYDDRELWSLVMVIGRLGLFTPAALIAKPIPGRVPGENYSD
jgi:alkylhydroperoxidase family enzyme